MSLLSKASNVVQNIFFLYDVTGFTQIRHSIPVATSCILHQFTSQSTIAAGLKPCQLLERSHRTLFGHGNISSPYHGPACSTG